MKSNRTLLSTCRRFIIILLLIPNTIWSVKGNPHYEDVISVAADYYDSKFWKGDLHISDSSVFFIPKNKKGSEQHISITDIIGYEQISNDSFSILTRNGLSNLFKVKKPDNIISLIEINRQKQLENIGIPALSLNAIDNIQIAEGYAIVEGTIVSKTTNSPDIIITTGMNIIESIIYMIDNNEVIFKEYPLEKDSPMISLPIKSLTKINLNNGREYNYAQDNSGNDIKEINSNTLKTKGLWVLNPDNQKLTFETASRYLNENEIHQYKYYKRKGRRGNTIMWVGSGIVVFDLILYELKVVDDLIEGAVAYDDPGPLIGYGISLAAGCTLAIIGSIIHSRAEKDLASFIAEWNAQQKISVTDKVSIGKTNNGYGLAFNF